MKNDFMHLENRVCHLGENFVSDQGEGIKQIESSRF